MLFINKFVEKKYPKLIPINIVDQQICYQIVKKITVKLEEFVEKISIGRVSVEISLSDNELIAIFRI